MSEKDEIKIEITKETLEDLSALLEKASESGAERALKKIGLTEETAAQDITELKGLLSALKTAKKTVITTVTKVITVGVLAAVAAFYFKDGVK